MLGSASTIYSNAQSTAKSMTPMIHIFGNHITIIHDGQCDPTALSKTKAEEAAASMSTK